MPTQPLVVPVGELTSLGIVKETTFATYPGAPSLFHSHEGFSYSSENILIPRMGARKRRGQNLPIPGGYKGSATLPVEPDPDTLGQLLAYSMGSQTAPTYQIVNTTVATGGSTLGSSAIPLNSTLGIQPGMLLAVDTAGNAENVTVAAITSTGITTVAPTTKNHAANAAVVLNSGTASVPLATLSTCTFGQLPTFMTEINRVTDAVDYLGCIVNDFSLDIQPGKALATKFGIYAAWEQAQASPATPSFSTRFPIYADNPNNQVLIAGAAVGQAGSVIVDKISLKLSNNIDANYRSVSGGRQVVTWPQQQRKVTGSITLGFENNAAYKAFLGGSGATAPQAAVPGVIIDVRMFSTDIIDAGNGVYFGTHFYLGNCFLSKHNVPLNPSAPLKQTFDFEAAETANGANDDLKILLVNQNTAIY
jgi:hypothetical protein